MFKIKHFMDKVERDDGQRLWIEPIKLTADLCEWCQVSHVLPHLGPPKELREWFEEHPDGYDYFRGRYHECLRHGPYRAVLQQMACTGRRDGLTLLYEGSNPSENAATALYEFLIELEAYCPPEG